MTNDALYELEWDDWKPVDSTFLCGTWRCGSVSVPCMITVGEAESNPELLTQLKAVGKQQALSLARRHDREA